MHWDWVAFAFTLFSAAVFYTYCIMSLKHPDIKHSWYLFKLGLVWGVITAISVIVTCIIIYEMGKPYA